MFTLLDPGVLSHRKAVFSSFLSYKHFFKDSGWPSYRCMHSFPMRGLLKHTVKVSP